MFKNIINKAVKQQKKIRACENSSGHNYKFSRIVDMKILNKTEKWDLYICANCGLGKFK